ADGAGARMLEDIRAGGVDAEHVTPDEGAATGTAYITVTPDGENTIVLDPGANHRLAPADVDRATPVIEQARVLLSQLEVPIDTVARALAVATGAGVRPVLTLSPAQPVPDDLLAGLDPLLVNQQEAGSLLGRSRVRVREAEEAARSLIKLGPRSVVITLGSDGAILATASGESRLAVEGEAQVVDTTGAGDALAGAMAAALARGLPLAEAVKAGMRVAALAVGRRGAR
ncbi:MAG: PfkB family carbohydrate kinase, partial [Acidimicrobiales bacterium]